MHPAGRRCGLAFVFAAEAGVAVRTVGGGTHGEKRDLADFHAGIQPNRQIGDIGEFQRNVTLEAWINIARCRMDNQAQPAKRAFSFDAAYEIIAKFDALNRVAKNELAGVDNKWLVSDFHQLGQVLLNDFGVNT